MAVSSPENRNSEPSDGEIPRRRVRLPDGCRSIQTLVLERVWKRVSWRVASLTWQPSLRAVRSKSLSCTRSEERRVGKECRSRWSADKLKKKKSEDMRK